MMPSARDNYLETEVLTATPQRLHLMLVEAAIRFANQGRRLRQQGDIPQACEMLIRAQEAAMQLVTGLNREGGDPLVSTMAGVYLFVHRSLVEANLRNDDRKIGDALRVLAVEQDTWRQVCEKSGSPAAAANRIDTVHFDTAAAPPPPPLGLPVNMASNEYAGGFSLEV